MKTYAEIQAEIKTLETQAFEARKKELSEVIADIRAKIETFGLTQKDIFRIGDKQKKSTTPKVAVLKGATYRHIDGRFWSGHGRRPEWIIKAAETPEGIAQFEVKNGGSVASPADAGATSENS